MSVGFHEIIIDVPNIYHRAWAVKHPSVKEAISLALNMLRNVESTFSEQPCRVWLLFDNPFAKDLRRREIDPTYKIKRTKADSDYARSLDVLQMILLAYKDNWVVVNHAGYEADDIVQPLVASIPSTTKTLLVSTDMDWCRSLSGNVLIARYSEGRYNLLTDEGYEKWFGFYPSRTNVCLYKAFRGDQSDCIPPGLPGLRKETLVAFIDRYGDKTGKINPANAMYNASETEDIQMVMGGMYATFMDKLPRLILNCKLVDFLGMTKLELSESAYRSKFQPHVLHDLYQSVGIDPDSDPRVAQFYAKEGVGGKTGVFGFFRKSMLPRK